MAEDHCMGLCELDARRRAAVLAGACALEQSLRKTAIDKGETHSRAHQACPGSMVGMTDRLRHGEGRGANHCVSSRVKLGRRDRQSPVNHTSSRTRSTPIRSEKHVSSCDTVDCIAVQNTSERCWQTNKHGPMTISALLAIGGGRIGRATTTILVAGHGGANSRKL